MESWASGAPARGAGVANCSEFSFWIQAAARCVAERRAVLDLLCVKNGNKVKLPCTNLEGITKRFSGA
jgi:hypothetical protein